MERLKQEPEGGRRLFIWLLPAFCLLGVFYPVLGFTRVAFLFFMPFACILGMYLDAPNTRMGAVKYIIFYAVGMALCFAVAMLIVQLLLWVR